MSKRKKYEHKEITHKIINELREHSCEKDDLIKLVINEFHKRPDAARKSVERRLKELKEWGLIEKKGDRFYWYIYSDIFEKHEDYELKLRHSKLLIPGLKYLVDLQDRVLGVYYPTYEDGKPVPLEELEKLKEYAKEHLKTYPDIWNTLEEYKEYDNEAKTSKAKDAEKKQVEANEKHKQSQELIRDLIISINHGTPLLGRCEKCPKVVIKS